MMVQSSYGRKHERHTDILSEMRTTVRQAPSVLLLSAREKARSNSADLCSLRSALSRAEGCSDKQKPARARYMLLFGMCERCSQSEAEKASRRSLHQCSGIRDDQDRTQVAQWPISQHASLQGGTSDRNGRASWSASGALGACAPCQWRQGRQSAGELAAAHQFRAPETPRLGRIQEGSSHKETMPRMRQGVFRETT